MVKRDSFFDLIHPEHLYSIALVFVCITAVLVSLIYLYLYQKKRNHFISLQLIDKLDNWIGEAIISTTAEYSHVYITPDIIDRLTDERLRQLAIDRLIDTKKNLTGSSADNIILLYEQLGLKSDSLRKFKSNTWYSKSKGIYELYMMNQHDYQSDIYKYINAKNEYVRAEAHTAIIGFTGFEGLSFLENLTYPLNEWQQIKLIEQLQSLNPGNMERVSYWLKSTNEYVVQFSLKLVDIYQLLEVHDKVIDCLNSNSEKTRYLAIKTLGNIANENTIEILKAHYPSETTGNKKIILKQVCIAGSTTDLPFLLNIIDKEEDIVKAEALKGIANYSPENLEELEESHAGTAMVTMIKQIKHEFEL